MPKAPATFKPAGQEQAARIRLHGKAHDQSRRAWYKTAAWAKLRTGQLHCMPICENCLLADDVVTPAEVVHHRQPHRGIRELFFDHGNLESVCKTCHDGEIQRGERSGWQRQVWRIEGQTISARVIMPMGLLPSAIPLTMVCGAPGSGKSTYVACRKGLDDVVIDIDLILAELSGTEVRTVERRDAFIEEAFIARNKRLASLARESGDHSAWFVVGAPGASVRQRWAEQLKPSRIVVFETPQHICEQRIRAQTERIPTADGQIEGVWGWWRHYGRATCDTDYL